MKTTKGLYDWAQGEVEDISNCDNFKSLEIDKFMADAPPVKFADVFLVRDFGRKYLMSPVLENIRSARNLEIFF
jgi:hypothetical protein